MGKQDKPEIAEDTLSGAHAELWEQLMSLLDPDREVEVEGVSLGALHAFVVATTTPERGVAEGCLSYEALELLGDAALSTTLKRMFLLDRGLRDQVAGEVTSILDAFEAGGTLVDCVRRWFPSFEAAILATPHRRAEAWTVGGVETRCLHEGIVEDVAEAIIGVIDLFGVPGALNQFVADLYAAELANVVEHVARFRAPNVLKQSSKNNGACVPEYKLEALDADDRLRVGVRVGCHVWWVKFQGGRDAARRYGAWMALSAIRRGDFPPATAEWGYEGLSTTAEAAA